jgi:hypothetical protein
MKPRDRSALAERETDERAAWGESPTAELILAVAPPVRRCEDCAEESAEVFTRWRRKGVRPTLCRACEAKRGRK